MKPPWPLTTFEEWMARESCPDWPMAIWLRLDLSGRLDPARLRQAMIAVSAQRPLFSSRIVPAPRGRLAWQPADPAADVRELPAAPPAEELPAAPPIDLRHQPPWRLWLRPLPGGHRLEIEFHHAVCDGIAAIDAARALLEYYRHPPQLDRLAPDLAALALRCRAGRLLQPADRIRQWGVIAWRAATYFARQPWSLDHAADAAATSAAWSLASRDAGPADVLRATARARGVTLNDLTLWAVFQALQRRRPPDLRRPTRLMAPMNLRGDKTASGVNIVGMVHLDAPDPDCRSDAALQAIARAMAVNRRYAAGRTTLVALNLGTALLGSPLRLACLKPHGATSVLSNMGTVVPPAELADAQGRIDLGDAAVLAFSAIPPGRRHTPLTFGMTTYAGRLRLSAGYQPRDYPAPQAVALLDDVVAVLTT